MRTTLRVLRAYHRRHPNAPPSAPPTLSAFAMAATSAPRSAAGSATRRTRTAAVDVYYPRLDHAERPPETPGQIDNRLAQGLVDLFVAAGAEVIYVGPNLPLTGPPGVVIPLVNHDNHLHVVLSA